MNTQSWAPRVDNPTVASRMNLEPIANALLRALDNIANAIAARYDIRRKLESLSLVPILCDTFDGVLQVIEAQGLLSQMVEERKKNMVSTFAVAQQIQSTVTKKEVDMLPGFLGELKDAAQAPVEVFMPKTEYDRVILDQAYRLQSAIKTLSTGGAHSSVLEEEYLEIIEKVAAFAAGYPDLTYVEPSNNSGHVVVPRVGHGPKDIAWAQKAALRQGSRQRIDEVMDLIKGRSNKIVAELTPKVEKARTMELVS